MTGSDELNAVLQRVETLDLLKNPRRVDASPRDGVVALEGEIHIDGKVATMQLVLDSAFPLRLPRFFLQPWDALGFIPHVDMKGFICFAEPEGLMLDRYQPLRIIEQAFERVVRVLTDGVAQSNYSDFTNEFEAYWGNLQETELVLSMVEPCDHVKQIIIAVDHEKNCSYVSDNGEQIASFFNAGDLRSGLTIEKGLYIPLQPGTLLTPPRPDGPFWTEDAVRNAVLPNISSENGKRLNRLIKGRRRKRYAKTLIIQLPCSTGGAAIFGIRFEGSLRGNPLHRDGKAERLVPLQLVRCDRNYLTRRGGASSNLTGKHVLLVGCGAIGGFLAFELARAGVLNLTLVDPDTLKLENCFRHVLGRCYCGKNKAKALSEEIREHLPYVSVKVYEDSIENCLENGIIDLTLFDLVISATGNPSVELNVNEHLHSHAKSTAQLYTWLEPMGIGGHALLITNTAIPGCLECLYTPADSSDTFLRNRAAFAAPGQFFGRAISGCATLHTPFGSMDAIRTAELAAREAISALTGAEPCNPLVSWKGDASQFIDEGFKLSKRYGASDTELNEQRYIYSNIQCRICGDTTITC